jgi:tRNA G46 methylase TrmB
MINQKLKQAYFAKQGNSSLKLNSEIKALSGFSGTKFLKSLQSLAKLFVNENTCYVEVGVFQGLTLMSVASEIPSFEAIGIDNFAFFDKEKRNQKIIEERRAKFGLDNVKLVNKDYEDALLDFKNVTDKKIGLYLVDGPHDYRSQM